MEEILQLNQLFSAFKIKANCIGFQKTKSVATYQVSLPPLSLIKDVEKFGREIALYLKYPSAPIFTTSLADGIILMEFPLPNREVINFAEVIKNKPSPNGMTLPIMLGNDLYGKDVWMDLADCPHMMIAGCSGSGKSSAIHTIIGNLLKFSRTKLILIDPKSIEFFHYENKPRIEIKYSYEETVQAITNLVEVMNHRFSLIKSGWQVSNFDPITVIIDEYADLSLQDSNKELYRELCKLAQKSRAAKIHIILSTQRPSSNLLDGNIKANFPARLACKVASKVDSRIILDATGAETLGGKGEAILDCQNHSKIRIKVAYSTPESIKSMFGF